RSARSAELVENALALAGGRLTIENIERLGPVAGDQGERQRGGEESDSQESRCPGQRVRRSARSHETGPAADAETAAFRPLKEHHADKRKHDHQMNDNNNGFHKDFTRGHIQRTDRDAPTWGSSPERRRLNTMLSWHFQVRVP